MSSEVFGGGDHMGFIDAWSSSLQCSDDRVSHLRGEIRIFTVRLFGASPARVTREIEVWTKHLLTSASACLHGACREDLRDELRIPRGSQRDRLRKTRAALGHVSVQYLVMKNRGNTESRVFEQPFLHGVGERRTLARILAFSLPRDLANTVFHHLGGFGRIEVTTIGCEICLRIDLRPAAPETSQLRDLFFERHSREQIGDAPFNRKTRILVIRTIIL